MLTYLLPSSMGASDLTLLAMLSTVIPASLATIIALLVRIYTTLFELIFGLIFFFLLNKSLPLTKSKTYDVENEFKNLAEEEAEERLIENSQN